MEDAKLTGNARMEIKEEIVIKEEPLHYETDIEEKFGRECLRQIKEEVSFVEEGLLDYDGLPTYFLTNKPEISDNSSLIQDRNMASTLPIMQRSDKFYKITHQDPVNLNTNPDNSLEIVAKHTKENSEEGANVILQEALHYNGKRFLCRICEKTYKTKYILRQHILTHSEERSHVCTICNKSFKRKRDLLKHNILHSEHRLFVCSICNKSFKRKSDLKTHSIIHSDKKTFSCSLCDKSFKRKSHLKSHLLYHSNEKQFVCNICDKSFKRKDNLNAHRISHSEQRPFACNFCDKAFKRKSDLNFHKSIHSGATKI